ncbi:hypothetical protein V7161_13035 [Neobacillus drentensis]
MKLFIELIEKKNVGESDKKEKEVTMNDLCLQIHLIQKLIYDLHHSGVVFLFRVKLFKFVGTAFKKLKKDDLLHS